MESVAQLEEYYRRLGQVEVPSSPEEVREAAKKLAEKDTAMFLFTGLEIQELNYVFAAYLAASKFPGYVKFRAYDVVDAFWHPPSKEYKNPWRVKPECLILWGGFSEPEKHESYTRMITDVIDRRVDQGGRTLLAMKKGGYPELDRRMKTYAGAVVVEYTPGKKVEVETVKGNKHARTIL